MPYTTDSRGYERLVKTYPDSTRILAEGDSWFAYPRRFIALGESSNIVQVLAEQERYVIYSTASIGDEAVTMMTGEQKYGFTKRLSSSEFDLVLFSGGGNDIVGKYDFDYFLKDRNSGADWQDCIDLNRLDNKLDQIESVYIELMGRVDYYSANNGVKVVSHNYDFCTPSPQGYELFDVFPIGESWMYPYLHQKNFTDADEQRAVVRFMLKRFARRLRRVQKKYRGKLFITDTQGTLDQGHWRNEIHPTPDGFRKITGLIDQQIRQVLAP